MKVDPAGLASVAARIADVLAEVTGGDPVHPPLAADPAATGAAGRLSAAGAGLVAALAEQALGLAATAAQLSTVTTAFVGQDHANAVRIASLGEGGADAAVTGWAPPAPVMPPDVRPPLAPAPPLPAEMISSAVHSGDVNAGEAFIAAWTRLSQTALEAADTVALTAEQLPEVWDSPVSTETVRSHLQGYSHALSASASRARILAQQATQHVEQTVQARSDIPTPQQFSALRQQIQQVSAANVRTGGAYAIPLSQLQTEKTSMDTQAVTSYGSYHAETDVTTAGEPGTDGAPQPGDPTGAPGANPDGHEAGPGQEGAEKMTPEKAGQMASMLPQMISTVLGAAGGMLGGAFSSVGQLPQGLMQAAGSATQSLQGLMKTAGTDGLSTRTPGLKPFDSGLDDEALAAGGGAGAGGGGATLPASGGSATLPPAVTPSTGPAPSLPTTPAGGLPPPAEPAVGGARGGGGMMPMGMPLGGMMGGAGAGGGAGGQEQAVRSKKVVVPAEPHTESVTGKVSNDRIARSVTAPDNDDPGSAGPPAPRSPAPVVRRITTVRPKDDE
ncbi:PPE domain-containing protein [Mycobacterium sp. GA-2829]|uniref:PPE domain-containing protein n=1 Tax=Mycobacterium sp. GA-2829 TaxID=1772283 RepID=UPI00073FFB5B|nr:PPE domain-containing protein [Mycobacterium sp. GA-2829]KUI36231.1 hypothetical protein AU194_16070 [Mycobacterium sp. GA-2829]